MMQRMREYTLERCSIEKNELLEDIKAWKPAGTIRVALSVALGGTLEQNQALRISSTHRGLTPDDVKTGDRFGGYKVDYVIPGRPYSQLYISREDALHEGTV